MLRHELARKEQRDFDVINVVYEPNYDDGTSVPCYFADQIHLACKNYGSKFDKGKERISNSRVKQCHYCQIFFAKNDEAMKKHLSICGAREGITCSFDNGQSLNYQDHFKYQGDLLFSVYFDFETTTGNAVFFDPKM